MIEIFRVSPEFVEENSFRRFVGIVSFDDSRSLMELGDYVISSGAKGFSCREWDNLRSYFKSTNCFPDCGRIWIVYPSYSYLISPKDWEAGTYPGVAFGDLWRVSSHGVPWAGYERSKDKYPCVRKL
jgi:hypothetical protein